MSKEFRRWKIDDLQVLPPSVQDYVAPDHLSRLIVAPGAYRHRRGPIAPR